MLDDNVRKQREAEEQTALKRIQHMKSTRPFSQSPWIHAGHPRVSEFENAQAFVAEVAKGKAFEAPAVIKTFPLLGKDLSAVFTGWFEKFKKHCAEKNVSSSFAFDICFCKMKRYAPLSFGK